MLRTLMAPHDFLQRGDLANRQGNVLCRKNTVALQKAVVLIELQLCALKQAEVFYYSVYPGWYPSDAKIIIYSAA